MMADQAADAAEDSVLQSQWIIANPSTACGSERPRLLAASRKPSTTAGLPSDTPTISQSAPIRGASTGSL
jgi:hypothetical protein